MRIGDKQADQLTIPSEFKGKIKRMASCLIARLSHIFQNPELI